jgi:integrase
MSKLTKQFVENEIKTPNSGQCFYRDEDIPGFGVRVTRKSKSYILEKRVDGVNRRITIGKCSELSFDNARKQACIMLGDIARGCDPKTGKRINTLQDITLREVFEKFLEVRPIRIDTQRNYYFAINKHFNDWLDLPITAITKDMVEQRHHDLTVSPNRLGTSGHGRANNALKKLSTLINFASDRFGTDDEPLIKANPVSRLSRNRAWHRIYPRQGIISDSKLKIWYRALHSLQHDVARDFFVFLLLTGMRFGETRKLKWCHVDFESEMLIVPRDLTKSDREHRLPLSSFLVEFLKRRCAYKKHSDYIFPSSRLREKPISAGAGILHKMRAKSGIQFTFHDLRRTFLTMGEKLNVPTYALKRLVNHSVSNDMTGRYLVLDLDRLRAHMTRITDAFIELLGIDQSVEPEWLIQKNDGSAEVIQLRLNFENEHPL